MDAPAGTRVVVPGMPQRSVPFFTSNTLSKKPIVWCEGKHRNQCFEEEWHLEVMGGKGGDTGERMAAVWLRSSSSRNGTPSSSVLPLL